MVMDFGELKAAMKVEIDEVFDHAMVLRDDDGALPFLKKIPATNLEEQKIVQVPWNPTAENFAQHIYQTLSASPYGLVLEFVRVWETATSFAEYR
jgi:6-pyruvoyl-tetrahydropterin synthase